MTKRRKGSVSQETFDDFLANHGMLEACEDRAIKEIIAEQLAEAGIHDLALLKGERE
jgi:antitoxin HicB